MSRYSLDGKVVLVTGAARGIGAEAARQLSAKGARLALLDVNREGLEATAAEIPGSIWIEADVTDMAQLERAVARTTEELGGVDVVIANAGIGPSGAFESLPWETIERTIQINLLGAMATVRAALPQLLEREGYALVVASLAAILHVGLLGHYVAAKAGLEAYADSLRSELDGRGVDVGVAYFGFIDTEMVAQGRSDPRIAALEERSRRGPFGKTYPVADAGAAIVRGVERRARRVAWPRTIRAVLPIRGFLPRLVERRSRGMGVAEIARELTTSPALDSTAPAEAARAAQTPLAGE